MSLTLRKVSQMCKVNGLLPEPNAVNFLLSLDADYSLVGDILEHVDREALTAKKLDVVAVQRAYRAVVGHDEEAGAAAAATLAANGGGGGDTPTSAIDLVASPRSQRLLSSPGSVMRAMQIDADDGKLRLIDAFSVPKWMYDANRKAFVRDERRAPLFGAPLDKLELFRQRYYVVHQRMLRNELFQKAVLPTDRLRRDILRLTPIDSLLGASDQFQTVLGALTQPAEGDLRLEDVHASVPIALTDETQTTAGLLVENAIVIARGYLRDGVFVVADLGLPPAESRSSAADGIVVGGGSAHAPDFFGGAPASEAQAARLVASLDDDDTFVVLSDLNLTDARTFDRLRTLFDGYAAARIVPNVFIFIGNFTAAHADAVRTLDRLAADLDELAALVLKYAYLRGEKPKKKAAKKGEQDEEEAEEEAADDDDDEAPTPPHFIFVPGPDDPAGSSFAALPRPKLPDLVTAKARARFTAAGLGARVHFTTNPCRIRYCEEEIVVFRADLVNKLRRHCVLPPTTRDNIEVASQHLVKTIIDQAHLCPLPLTIQPVYWAYDHALRLYPPPHALIIADRADSFEHVYCGTRVFNPGSFAVDTSFVMYKVASREVDWSRLEGGDEEEEEEDEDDDVEEVASGDDDDDDMSVSASASSSSSLPTGLNTSVDAKISSFAAAITGDSKKAKESDDDDDDDGGDLGHWPSFDVPPSPTSGDNDDEAAPSSNDGANGDDDDVNMPPPDEEDA